MNYDRFVSLFTLQTSLRVTPLYENAWRDNTSRVQHQTALAILSTDDRYKIVLNNFLTAATEDYFCPQQHARGSLDISKNTRVMGSCRVGISFGPAWHDCELMPVTFAFVQCRRPVFALWGKYCHVLPSLAWSCSFRIWPKISGDIRNARGEGRSEPGFRPKFRHFPKPFLTKTVGKP